MSGNGTGGTLTMYPTTTSQHVLEREGCQSASALVFAERSRSRLVMSYRTRQVLGIAFDGRDPNAFL